MTTAEWVVVGIAIFIMVVIVLIAVYIFVRKSRVREPVVVANPIIVEKPPVVATPIIVEKPSPRYVHKTPIYSEEERRQNKAINAVLGTYIPEGDEFGNREGDPFWRD